jgi:hypothetical protein
MTPHEPISENRVLLGNTVNSDNKDCFVKVDYKHSKSFGYTRVVIVNVHCPDWECGRISKKNLEVGVEQLFLDEFGYKVEILWEFEILRPQKLVPNTCLLQWFCNQGTPTKKMLAYYVLNIMHTHGKCQGLT